MRVVALGKPKEISMIDVPVPIRKPAEALIRMRAVGICGSDIAAYRGMNPLVSYPRIIGHEVAGEIVEIDQNTKGFKKGDRVILDPYLFCGHCYPCSIKRTNCCENLKVIGVHVDGGMQEFITHPADMMVSVPDAVRWEHIPLAEPMTIALHALHRTGLKNNEYVAINGAGTIGLLTAIIAKTYGAEPILIDLIDERLAMAGALGVAHTINPVRQDLLLALKDLTDGRMPEVVVEASGANQAIRSTIDMASYAGRIALTGWPKSETSLPTDVITKKELDIYGSRNSAGEFEEAFRLMSSGEVNAQAIISKYITFDEIPSVVQELSDHPERYLKVNALL